MQHTIHRWWSVGPVFIHQAEKNTPYTLNDCMKVLILEPVTERSQMV